MINKNKNCACNYFLQWFGGWSFRMAKANNNAFSLTAEKRDWCFTYFTDEIGWVPTALGGELYLVYQWELCPTTNKRHAQGFVQFKNAKKGSTMKNWIKTASFQWRKGTPKQAADYCKEDKLHPSEENGGRAGTERGILQNKDKSGKRNDLEALKDDIRGGMSLADLRENHSETFAKYPKFVHEYRQDHSKNRYVPLTEWILRPWQRWIWDKAHESVPDDRAIYWFYDINGGNGKSWLARLLNQEMDVFYSNGGKANDLLYAYEGQPIVIFDYTRDYESYVGYGPMEQMKNGFFFSSKYQSTTKSFKVPHIFVFANFKLDETKLSKDRIHKFDFHEDGSVWWSKPHTPIKEQIQ